MVPPLSMEIHRGRNQADIYRHRHLIHNLTMFGDLAGLDKYNYPNLRKLIVDYTDGANQTI
jgi:hypothetical protein